MNYRDKILRMLLIAVFLVPISGADIVLHPSYFNTSSFVVPVQSGTSSEICVIYFERDLMYCNLISRVGGAEMRWSGSGSFNGKTNEIFAEVTGLGTGFASASSAVRISFVIDSTIDGQPLAQIGSKVGSVQIQKINISTPYESWTNTGIEK
jgi:hypothetical protein